MSNTRALLLVLYFLSLRLIVPAQPVEREFGQISLSDFRLSLPGIDEGAGALVLFDIGSAKLEGYEDGFRLEFKRTLRIKILNKNGFDAAKVSVYFSPDDNGRGKLKHLEAKTYNLENGSILTTEVAEKDFFIEKSSGDMVKESFAFPNVREGSIVEMNYRIRSSSYFKLRAWDFQGKYPVVFSKYSVRIPDIFNFVILPQGSHPVSSRTENPAWETIVAGNKWYGANVHTVTWEASNIPAIQTAPFVSTIENYISRVQFQLVMQPVSPGKSVVLLKDWKYASNRLLSSNSFGDFFLKNDKWLHPEVEKICGFYKSKSDKAKALFRFVRDHFTKEGNGLFVSSGLSSKAVFEKRAGSVAEINLLLIAMLNSIGINARPVILSTRDNGLTNVTYPVMDNFNYVVIRVDMEDSTYYLDASERNIGFNKLPLSCYNGHARVVDTASIPVFFSPDSLTETKITNVTITNDSGGFSSLDYVSALGYYESLHTRNILDSSNNLSFFQKIASSYSFPTSIIDASIDSFKNIDEPITLRYKLRFDPGKEKYVYINPVFEDAIKDNPFKSDSIRLYPVEMPYCSDHVYILSMQIPEGYEVEEMPKPIKAIINNDGGLFEYLLRLNGRTIELRSRVYIKKAIFYPEDYQLLRDFFSLVTGKQSEPIVFRKK